MLHRMGMAKSPPADTKASQVKVGSEAVHAKTVACVCGQFLDMYFPGGTSLYTHHRFHHTCNVICVHNSDLYCPKEGM